MNIGDPSCTGTGTHTPQQGTAPAQDPLSYLRPPCSPCTVVAGSDIHITGGGGYTGPAGSVSYSDGVYTVVPGTYNSISVGSSGNTVNFSPGTYVINGMGGCPAACLNVQGGNTLNGSSVMFYFTNQATVNFTGTANVQLSPQSTGDYAGILFYQDPNDTNVDGPRLGGDNGSSFDGVLYFPKDNLTFFGTNVSYSTGMVISGAIELSGNPTVTLEGAAGLPPGVNIVKNAILVE